MRRSTGVPLHRSIRTRITLAFAVGSLLTTILVGVVVDASLMTSGRDLLRERAVDAVAAATATYDFTATIPIGATVSARSAPAAMRRDATRGRVVTWFDGRTMWAARRIDGKHLLTVRVSASDLLTQRSDVRAILVALAVATVVLSTVSGWLVAGTLTRRLRTAASRLTGSAPLRTVAVDEVGELVQRIEALTEALAARLEAERAFSADVAHELRTPLTALSAATELLPEDEEALLVRRQTLRLRRLVEDLLELARAERSFELHAEPHDLGELTLRILGDQEDVEVHISSSTTQLTDAALLDRVLLNLVTNARRHGAPPIRVEVDGSTIAVSDAGPGFPAAVLQHGPRRFGKHGAEAGVGLGLAIATAWTARLGANLSLDNTDTGARATITFVLADGPGPLRRLRLAAGAHDVDPPASDSEARRPARSR